MTQQDLAKLAQAAMQAHRAGDLPAARKGYESALALDPANPGLLNSLGIVLTDLQQLPDAEAVFRRAIAADPKAPELWMNLAKAQRIAGDETGEGASLAGALAIDQRHFMARVRQAELYERQGNAGLATHDWSAVLTMAEGMDQAQPGLAAILDRARAYVAARGAEFEAAVTPAIEAASANVSSEARRRFSALMGAATGKRKIYRNECAGLFYPFLPPDEFFGRHHFDWMETIEAKSDVIRVELEALLDSGGAGFAPYVSMPSGTPENKWSELSDSNRWDACYLWKYGERQHAIADKCPQTMAALDKIARFDVPGRGPTAFFSLLRPQTKIPPHTGVSNTRTIVHLPLIVPEGCGFRVGGETRMWRVGEAFAFDDTIEHEAWNTSDQLRAVLIFDVWNPYISDEERMLLRTFYTAADGSGLRPEPVHDI
jgi:aspartate beta-hydroxylase